MPVLADPGGLEVGVGIGLSRVVGGNQVVPPALLVEPEERPSPLGVVVGDAKRDCGAPPREAGDEEGAVTKFHQGRDVDAVEEGPGLLGGEDRSFAGLDDVPPAPDRVRGIEGEDLVDDEPVEKHPKRREVLLGARRRECAGELLEVGRDHHRLELVQGEVSALARFGEAADGREVREARVRVPDVGGVELPEAPLGAL